MRLMSTAFFEGEHIPVRYTCDGENHSPPFAWAGAPRQTMSFVLLCDDPDALLGKWHHWAVYNIPATQHALAAGVPPVHATEDFRQAVNDFRHPGYGGPCPPPSHGPHRYFFRLLALSVTELPLRGDPTCKEVEAEARKHVLAEAQLIGLFGRKSD